MRVGVQPVFQRPAAAVERLLVEPGVAAGRLDMLGDAIKLILGFVHQLGKYILPGLPEKCCVQPGCCPAVELALAPRRIHRLYETGRSEEHTSELPSPMRNSYAVVCLKKTNPEPSEHHDTHK